MRAIELFAGAGGAALGLEAAGIEHAALCEWDPDACATLRAAGLGPVVEGDVRDLDAIAAAAGESCDLLWSSFPCQAWSTAGKRQGARDERNGWPWTVDAIDRFCPRWFLGENVRGLLNHRGGCVYGGGTLDLFGGDPSLDCPRCYFDRVILRQLRERFDHVGYWLLDAADYGVPQHRRRVILWAGPAPLEKPVATHGPRRALSWVSMGQALGVNLNDPRPAPTIATTDGTGLASSSDRAKVAQIFKSGVVDSNIAKTKAASEPWRLDLDDSVAIQWAVVAAGETGCGKPRGIQHPSPTISTSGNAYLLKGRCTRAASEPWRLDQPSEAVLARDVKGYSGGLARGRSACGASDGMYLATGRRRLTVEECARLQDFPDAHPWQGNSKARYRQIGNAVPPTLARVVADALLQTDTEGAA